MPQSPNYNDRANRVDFKARLKYQTDALLNKAEKAEKEVKDADSKDKRRPEKGRVQITPSGTY